MEPSGQCAYVLTNYHVLEGASQISVVFFDSLTITGDAVGVDTIRDLAVIRTCGSVLFAALQFRDAQSVSQGDEVLVMGYPLDVDTAVVTKGIISAFYYDSDQSRWLIQTDAPINPGNSGGPLLTIEGGVIGVNTFVVRGVASGIPIEGFGFAVSQRTIAEVLPGLKSQGLVTLPTATPTTQTTSGYGPIDGAIIHNPDDGFIDDFDLRSFSSNVIIEATFENPYSASVGSWDHGFIFRELNSNSFHAVIIRSDGKLYHVMRLGEVSSSEVLDSGTSGAINTNATGTNKIQVSVVDNEAWMFTNGSFVSKLDVSGLIESGNVSVISGYFNGDGVSGAITSFKGLTVRPLITHTVANGELAHDPSAGTIKTRRMSITSDDMIVQARFTNPYPSQDGPWDYGFLFRRSSSNTFHAVGIHSDGTWFHRVRLGSVDSTKNLGEGGSSQILLGNGEANKLSIVAIGDEAWFFINDVYIAKLNLSDLRQAGDIAVITGYFTGDEIAGQSTKYEDVIVWEPSS